MKFANLLKFCVLLTLATSIHGQFFPSIIYLITTVLIRIQFFALPSFLNSKNKCDSLLNEFAIAISDFERCAIQKAVPVTLCSNCLNQYIANLQNFRELISTHDDNNVQMNCGDHFIDQNSLNIVYKRYMNSRDLWNSGHCTSKPFMNSRQKQKFKSKSILYPFIFQDCFTAACNPDKMSTVDNITRLCQPNANIVQIKTDIEHLKVCIDESAQKKDDVCKSCAQNHTQLEHHLEQLMSVGAGVCFEIIDVVISFLFVKKLAHHSSSSMVAIVLCIAG